MSKILVVEDDNSIRTGLVDNLTMQGYQVVNAPDGETGLKLAKDSEPDLIILDIMMPGMGGFEFCRQLRSQSLHVPVIILSARGAESDKVLGLELGADDYVSKPFSPHELMMRVKAVLRRTHAPEPEVVEFSGIRLNFLKYEVTKRGKPVKLTANEFAILKLLVQNADQPVSRHKLISLIWGEGVVSRTIDTHIWKLREGLEDNPSKPKHIITVHRIGYKFVP